MTYFIVSIVLYVGLGLGGFFVGERVQAVHDENLPAKTQIINQYQTTKNDNSQITSQESVQMTTTIITPKTNMVMTVDYHGHTNISTTFSSTTNTVSKTNK